VHVFDWQTAPPAVPHGAPSASPVKLDVLMFGWQVWHALDGFGAPAG
jgi:hypothetical protein